MSALTSLQRLRNRLPRLATRTLAPLGLLERLFVSRAESRGKPLFLLLGLPRSGTTLVYQYLVHRLHLSYFTNGVGVVPSAPALVSWAQRTFCREYRSDFTSRYGKVRGATAPREAGAFWGRFFDLDDYIRFEEIASRDVETLRRTVARVQAVFGDVAFVNKNVKHLLRVDALARIFPQAYFIEVRRDVEDVGLSVLRARRRLLRNPAKWWSVRPPEYEALRNLPPHEQVARQVSALGRKLAEDLDALEPRRVIALDYRDFCREPEALVRRLRDIDGTLEFKNAAVSAFDVVVHRPESREEEALLEMLGSEVVERGP